MAMASKKITQIVASVAQAEGRGERVFRSIGRPELKNLDPFLLLDEFGREQPGEGGGFPDHPHRGFETVTYMLNGRTDHEVRTGPSKKTVPRLREFCSCCCLPLLPGLA